MFRGHFTLSLKALAILGMAWLVWMIALRTPVFPLTIVLHDRTYQLDFMTSAAASVVTSLMGLTALARQHRAWNRWLTVSWVVGGIYVIAMAWLLYTVHTGPRRRYEMTLSVQIVNWFFREPWLPIAFFCFTLVCLAAAYSFTLGKAWRATGDLTGENPPNALIPRRPDRLAQP